MSDTDLRRGDEPSSSAEHADSSYAFLVHSQKTLTQNLPPRVDNKLLARQRRRRTSPEDHAILEAEYKRNSKPDKATRAAIVDRVSLGEKEVQIWFQNRRQNDRRRSKPLDPNEYPQPKATRPNSSESQPHEEQHHDFTSSQIFLGQESVDGSSTLISPESSFLSTPAEERVETRNLPSSQTTIALQQPDAAHTEKNTQEDLAIPNKSALHTDPVKRKRAISDLDRPTYSHPQTLDRHAHISAPSLPPSLRISLSFDGEAVLRKDDDRTPSPPKPRDSMRISMSADGEALIRTANEPSPTKNRVLLQSRRAPLGGLRRSSSTSVLGAFGGNDEIDPKEFGRSRDPRAWELHCDTDARSALSLSSTHLRRASGSNHIGPFASRNSKLTRRKSELGSRTALAPRTNLPNATVPSGQPAEKRQKLTRTVSSVARLESHQRALTDKPNKGSSKHSKLREFHSGDSDKENWIPGTQTSGVRRTAPNNSARRGVLQKSATVQGSGDSNRLLTGGRIHRGYRGTKKDTKDENVDPVSEEDEDDEEVSRFMAASGGPSQEEDLDCIQGLLSLSQGAWR